MSARVEDYFDWPPEIQEAHDRAIRSIWERDLQPLADYLRSGMPIDQMWRDALANAIEGKHYGLRLEVRSLPGRRGRPQSPSQALAEHRRKLAIGRFIEERLVVHGSGGFDAALADAVAVEEFRLRGKFAARRAAEALQYARGCVPVTGANDFNEFGGSMVSREDDGTLVIVLPAKK